jgi:hypothetical protein
VLEFDITVNMTKFTHRRHRFKELRGTTQQHAQQQNNIHLRMCRSDPNKVLFCMFLVAASFLCITNNVHVSIITTSTEYHRRKEELLLQLPPLRKQQQPLRGVTQHRKQHQLRRDFPRTIEWNGVSWDVSASSSKIQSLLQIEHQSTNSKEKARYPFLDIYEPHTEKDDQKDLEYYLVQQFTDDYQNHCVYMKDWQSRSYPTCNSIHEIGLADPTLLHVNKHGGWRQTYRHEHIRGIVLKMLHLDEDHHYPFHKHGYEIHRVDALISEHLTSSPYVLDTYGYCGMSALYEEAEQTLKYGAHEDEKLDEATKVRWAYEIAKGISDIHSIDYPLGNNATIVHRDIKPDNVLITKDGKAKIGDFNDSILRKWNQTSGAACPFYNKPYPLHWGNGFKPVEMAAKGYPRLDDKADVFGLGALLFMVLTGNDPYSRYEKDELTKVMTSGRLPEFPKHYNTTQTKDLSDEVLAIIRAIQQTMKLDPKDRPTSTEVVAMLKPGLQYPVSVKLV